MNVSLLNLWAKSKTTFKLPFSADVFLSPEPLSISLGSFRIFSKIRGDIREW